MYLRTFDGVMADDAVDASVFCVCVCVCFCDVNPVFGFVYAFVFVFPRYNQNTNTKRCSKLQLAAALRRACDVMNVLYFFFTVLSLGRGVCLRDQVAGHKHTLSGQYCTCLIVQSLLCIVVFVCKYFVDSKLRPSDYSSGILPLACCVFVIIPFC